MNYEAAFRKSLGSTWSVKYLLSLGSVQLTDAKILVFAVSFLDLLFILFYFMYCFQYIQTCGFPIQTLWYWPTTKFPPISSLLLSFAIKYIVVS